MACYRKSAEHTLSVVEAPAAVLSERAARYADHARSEATRRAYREDWAHFAGWCAVAGVRDLPAAPETVALYLTAHAEALRPATLARRLVAIADRHEQAGEETPTRARRVRAVMRGIRRERGAAQEQKAALLTDDLRAVLAALPPTTLQGTRDRALLLCGWAGAFRRSELAALSVGDIAFRGPGMVVQLRRSKTDQEGKGRALGIPASVQPVPVGQADCCPVRAVRRWIEAAALNRGPLFRGLDRWGNVTDAALTGHGVAYIIKRAVEAAGFDAARYSGHSLRAGLATSAAMAGASNREIRRQTGHQSDRVLERYIRDGELFRENVVARTGL